MRRFLSSPTVLRMMFFAGLMGIACGLTFVAVQQEIRHAANDPQIALAEDAQNALTQGEPIVAVIPAAKVDLSISLSPFIVIYDDNGDPIAGNAMLDGKLPRLPKGVFGYVEQNGEDRVTWQPEPELRFAAVITRYAGAKGSGFILAARSITESEARQRQLLMLTVAAWFVSVLFIIVAVTTISRIESRHRS